MDNKNLVVIDYQNDFVKLDGSLTCGQSGIDIESDIVSKIKSYKNNNIFVTIDTHYDNNWEEDNKTPEASIYPKHCIMGTEGHKIYGKVNEALENINHTIVYKNTFATDKLAKKIIEKNNCDKKIIVEICGVATSVCVFQNTILLYNYFVTNNIDFQIIIDKSCVACFDAELEKTTLNYLVSTLGVTVNGMEF